ncbi:GNAT family N-acetyltransferase [Patescibacteria group bacterium]|nr:GNAT family N-acetyltransferase [Patescibacteria group bacterium]MBU0777376.1 GNAT family N-acetyltransferase [Patescibacteria group bacterium]MBU0845644.1 GNAT family N-acetyltransferase [Patescibacteria group bacterium]MBU0923075.1 GNAT family N-acetyltransferase [Patescibacteria group bacterium]MBU1066514.1 GNAT family N-acetyltransferase [Patescibacteria group bacterium]
MHISDKKPKEYLIVRIKASHAKILANFFKSLIPQTIKLFHPHPFSEEFLKKLFADKKDVRIFLSSRKKRKIAGYAFVSRFPLFPMKGYFGIVISEEFRGKGLAKGFTNQLFDQCKKEGINKILLNVYESNSRAIKLYEVVGFKKIEVAFYDRYLIAFREVLRNDGLKGSIIKVIKSLSQIDRAVEHSIWMLKDL